VHQPPQFLGGWGDLDPFQGITGLGRSQGMADRANTANPLGYGGHFTVAAPKTELLKSTEFSDMKTGIGHLSGIVQLDSNLGVAFNPGNR